ncbi:cytochrome P450 76C1-like [Rutidosis leptorrhynchoides]|uniref:cytochrome P450 76C1-like n=1 Tax=Rutidosis leptorrhynchoides TaxID=125765 RepID=UPI003A9A0492
MAQLNNLISWWWEVRNNNNKFTMSLVTISVLIFAILWYKFKYLSFKNGLPSLPPGPRSLPIVGFLPFLGPELNKQFTNMARTYGPIFKFYVGTKLHVIINTPELAKVVVRDQDETFANHNLTIAASIITYGGQDIAWANNSSHWRNLRKMFVHEVLSNKNLDACSPFRRNEVRKTIKNVYSKIGTAVNISEIAFSTETNVITNMVWENYSSDNGANGTQLGVELQMLASKIVELLGTPNLSDFFPSLAWFDVQGVAREMKKQLKKLEELLNNIIDDRIKYNSRRTEDGVKHEVKKDFLQVLLDLKDQKDATSLNFFQIKALLMDIMVAGTETTTTMIEWTMTEILKNHNVMKRVQEELSEIVGINNIVEEFHLAKLKYLDATIKETSRLHPVAPLLIPRSPSKTCIVGGYMIPKGCNVFLNVWSIQRDPRYWDNPQEFNPERFLSYEDANKWDNSGNNLNFFPFGSGRRLCPGLPVAEIMQKYILASFFHSFDWSLPNGEKHDVSEKFGITLKKLKPLIAIPSPRLPNLSLYV